MKKYSFFHEGLWGKQMEILPGYEKKAKKNESMQGRPALPSLFRNVVVQFVL